MAKQAAGRRKLILPHDFTPVPPVAELPQNERLSLYEERFHDTARFVFPNGIIQKVDPPIKDLIQDTNKLDCIKQTIYSCSGGDLLPKHYERSGWDWGTCYDVKYSSDPSTKQQATAFETDLRKLKVDCKGIVGGIHSFARNHPPEWVHRKLIEYSLSFNQEPTLEALDATWQAVHGVVKKHLRLQKYSKEHHKAFGIDPPIEKIIDDMNMLGFAKTVRDSCAGGRDKPTKLGDQYLWDATFELEFSQNPGQLDQTIQFEQELRDLKVECGGMTGCVLPGHRTLPARDTRKEFREEIYELAFNKPPTLEALDATWQAVHKVVKKHLK